MASSERHPREEIGQRLRQARRARGLGQKELASLVERSESWLRGIERGRLDLDRRSVIDRLAEVLQIDVAWLLGQPYPPLSRNSDAGHRSVPALRTAIRRTSLILSGHPDIPAIGLPVAMVALRPQVAAVTQLRQAADLPAVMAQLPMLIESLNTTLLEATGQEVDEAQVLVVEVNHVARMVLNQLGHHDLAWTAVENAALAAARLGHELVQACSAWDRCGVLLHTGSLGEASVVAEAALDRLEPRLAKPTPPDLSLWGALQLRCAVTAARRHDRPAAWQYLREAEETARRLGVERNDFQTVFGLRNVQIHAVEIAVELGQPDVALSRIQGAQVDRLPSRERIVHHRIDVARAHGQLGDDASAVRSLRSAAALSPHYVYSNPMARALVSQLGRRPQPSAVSAGLGSLTRAMDLS